MKTSKAPTASVAGARLASSAPCALLALGIQLLSLAAIATAAPADLDPDFGTGGRVVFEQSTGSGFESWNQVLPLPNGDALVAGWTQTSTGYVTGRFIVRLDTDGARVSSFGTDGQVTLNLGSSTSGVIDDLLVLPGGRILAVVSENYALNTKITGIGDFAHENVAGGVDAAFGVGVEHGD